MKIAVEGIELSSPMEALFYGLCCFHEIPVESASGPRDMIESGGLYYRPHFHVAVPKILDLWAEISDGSQDGVMRPLRSAWRTATGRPLVVLYRDDLDDLREASRPSQFAARLRQVENTRRLIQGPWQP